MLCSKAKEQVSLPLYGGDDFCYPDEGVCYKHDGVQWTEYKVSTIDVFGMLFDVEEKENKWSVLRKQEELVSSGNISVVSNKDGVVCTGDEKTFFVDSDGGSVYLCLNKEQELEFPVYVGDSFCDDVLDEVCYKYENKNGKNL